MTSPTACNHSGSSPSAVRCAASFLALILGWVFVNVFSYSSHSGFAGASVAFAAALVGVYSYLTCPRQPRWQRYLALLLGALNIWLAADTVVRYAFFGRQ